MNTSQRVRSRLDSLRSPAPALTVRRIRWGSIVRWSLIGTAVLLLSVLFHLQRLGGNPIGLIQPGTAGPSYATLQRDFPKTTFPSGLGLDGQQYYVVARSPWHFNQVRHELDRPRYRLQHPLYSWAAWVVHPSGGGLGLVYAMFLVGLLASFGGAVATGALSTTWRGPPWLAALFPILPGVWLSLRVSVADGMAIALALAALTFAARRRNTAAVLFACLAVLAKEPVVIVFAGWAMSRRNRRDSLPFVVSAAVVIGWMAVLRNLVPGHEHATDDITGPFQGWTAAWHAEWSHGNQWVGLLCVVLALATAATALIRNRLGHPLSWVIVLELCLLVVAGSNPIGESFGAPRTTLALLAVSMLAIATPSAYGRSPKMTSDPALITGLDVS